MEDYIHSVFVRYENQYSGIQLLIEMAKYIGEQGMDAEIHDPRTPYDPAMIGGVPATAATASAMMPILEALYNRHAGQFGGGYARIPPFTDQYLLALFRSQSEAVLFKIKFSDRLFDMDRAAKIALEYHRRELIDRLKNAEKALEVILEGLGADPVKYHQKLIRKLQR